MCSVRVAFEVFCVSSNCAPCWACSIWALCQGFPRPMLSGEIKRSFVQSKDWNHICRDSNRWCAKIVRFQTLCSTSIFYILKIVINAMNIAKLYVIWKKKTPRMPHVLIVPLCKCIVLMLFQFLSLPIIFTLNFFSLLFLTLGQITE